MGIFDECMTVGKPNDNDPELEILTLKNELAK